MPVYTSNWLIADRDFISSESRLCLPLDSAIHDFASYSGMRINRKPINLCVLIRTAMPTSGFLFARMSQIK